MPSQFVPRHVNYRYRLLVPEYVNPYQGFRNWERERFESMENYLIPGDVLFDIGAEQGWQSVIYARFVGAQNMVLVEPLGVLWPNIKQTWVANGLRQPRATFPGFFADTTNLHPSLLDYNPEIVDGWPVCATGEIWNESSFRHLSEGSNQSVRSRLDDWAKKHVIYPDALTIDVEGAELLVLKGAEKTLADYNLRVWVSIHPQEMADRYGQTIEELHDYMFSVGYTGEHLATDHEEHWFFHK